MTGTRGADGTGGTSPSLEDDGSGSVSTLGADVGGRTVSAERSTFGFSEGTVTGVGSSLLLMWLGSAAGSGISEIHSVACVSGLIAMVATWMFHPQQPVWTVAYWLVGQASFSFTED